MTVEEMSACVPLPAGYRFERLRRPDIAEVVTFIGAWFPGIRVGGASGYTRTEFFEAQVTLDAERETDVSVVPAGWRLIGITPGYDRELIAPGIVKRVYEALYAKVLVADASLLRPETENLTTRTRALFDFVFPGERAAPLA